MERFSRNRKAILECLRQTDEHPSAEWVYKQLRPDFPSLSLGTVYRNLCQLKEAGLIRSMGVLAGQEHFDGKIGPHAHAMCSRCGKIVDVGISTELDAARNEACACTGYQIDLANFVGLCPSCQKALASKEEQV